MASKSKTMYVCNQCSYESAKWFGQCPGCGEWNTMEETVVNPMASKKRSASIDRGRAVVIDEISNFLILLHLANKSSYSSDEIIFVSLKILSQ